MTATYSQIVSMNPLKDGKYAPKVSFEEARQLPQECLCFHLERFWRIINGNCCIFHFSCCEYEEKESWRNSVVSRPVFILYVSTKRDIDRQQAFC